MIELAEQAMKNLATIKKLHSEISSIEECARRETTRLTYDVYQPKIRQLEAMRDAEIQRLEDDRDHTVTRKRAEATELKAVVKRVERILDFLRLSSAKDLTVDSEDIKVYDRYLTVYKEDLGYFLDDTYLKIRLLIVGNDKPKNKFSLIAMGKCLFHEELLKLPYSYGMPVYAGSRYELEILLKDFPTVEEAKAWLNKNRAKLNNYLPGVADYDLVKKEYEDTTQDYKPEDFESFLMARCRCGYFYTEFERNRISRREEKLECPRCNTLLDLKPQPEYSRD